MSGKADNLKRIAISPENYEWLASQGRAGQSFNDVIDKLREREKFEY